MDIYKSDGTLALSVDVTDNSYRRREIMGVAEVALNFSLSEHLEIPLGSYIIYEGVRYELLKPSQIKMIHTRNFEYTAKFSGIESKAKMWKFRNIIDGRLQFSLTARPEEHLQLLVDNLNSRDEGWTMGSYPESVEKCITYSYVSCWEALGMMADTFNIEFEIVGKEVSLCKVEHNKENALPLAYGKGRGFVSGVTRASQDDVPMNVLYLQGGEQNINPQKYGAKTLQLPKGKMNVFFDGIHFQWEDGYDESKGKEYLSENQYISLLGEDRLMRVEASLDCTEIYPKRVGKVSEVTVVDAAKNIYDFVDNTIPSSLNYADYLIPGESMTVTFMSQHLAGKTFDVKYIHDPQGSKPGRRFEVVSQIIDGEIMPSPNFPITEGAEYVVLGCTLPPSYFRDDVSHSGAEWEMLKEGVRYLHQNGEQKFTFNGTLDGIWSKSRWNQIGGLLICGGYISFSDERFQKVAQLVRIVAIKDYINNPHSPEISLSNEVVSPGFGAALNAIEGQGEALDEARREQKGFVHRLTERKFGDAMNSIAALQTIVENLGFSEGINPISVHSMMIVLGSEQCQFRFTTTASTSSLVSDAIFAPRFSGGIMVCPASSIQHMTYRQNAIVSSQTDGYFAWNVDAYSSAPIPSDEKVLFLYIVAESGTNAGIRTAHFVWSKEAVKQNYVEGSECFLVGLWSEADENGERFFTPMYGFTEISPRRMVTNEIRTANGNSYIDLARNAMRLGESLSYADGQLTLYGTLVQSPGGDTAVLPVFRGAYMSISNYYLGDEVTFDNGEGVSTYRRIGSGITTGIEPTDEGKWMIVASAGEGKQGAAIVFRGDYDASADYYGTDTRSDVVKSGAAYFCAANVGGQFKGRPTTDTAYWKPFGASFESVATSLLLAQYANVAGWIFNGDKMWSQWGHIGDSSADSRSYTNPDFIPNLEMDGVNGVVRIRNGNRRTILQNKSLDKMVADLRETTLAGHVNMPTSVNLPSEDLIEQSGPVTGTSSNGINLKGSYKLAIGSSVKASIPESTIKVMLVQGEGTYYGTVNVIVDIEISLKVATTNYRLLSSSNTIATNITPTASGRLVSVPATTFINGNAIKEVNLPIMPMSMLASLVVTASIYTTDSSRAVVGGLTIDIANEGGLDVYDSNTGWTLIGNDGLYVSYQNKEFKVSNSGTKLQVMMNGLPSSDPKTVGVLYTDSNNFIKVSK